MDAAARWADAVAAATLLGVDPVGLGGAIVRGRPGGPRDIWLAAATRAIGGPSRRMPAGIEDDRLLGGLDLTATLNSGRPVAQSGLLAEVDGGALVAAMAERLDAGVTARLTAALDLGRVHAAREGFVIDRPARFALLALDEGAEPDERAPAALAERLAFALDLDGLAARDGPKPDDSVVGAAVLAARSRLAAVAVGEDAVEALVATAAAFGVASLRAPTFALRAARAAAALRGGAVVDEADLGLAARLVFGPRATRTPAAADAADPPPPENDPPPQTDDGAEAQTLADRIVEAVRAVAPEDVLAGLAVRMARRARGAGRDEGGAGVRGRPA
ncbi:MAG: magnesium chelatase ATPase subunit D, partial [Alphaproteobacteria bacterium]|nr:magnesium chelatase ATPase subunit D [Alphaproteobacteria bacterium]